MRVVSILATVLLTVGLAACGGGGGPSDLNLGPTPTTATTSTTTAPSISGVTPTTPVNGSASAPLPAYASLVARALPARLPVYNTPNAARASRVLANPWTGAPNNTKTPQVLLVESRRSSDGWVKVQLPVRPRGTTGWVRASDVTIGQIVYQVRVALNARRITVLGSGKTVYQGPIVVGAVAKSTPAGRYFLHRILTTPTAQMTADPYVYGLMKRLAVLLPLGTPVDVAA